MLLFNCCTKKIKSQTKILRATKIHKQKYFTKIVTKSYKYDFLQNNFI